MTTEWISIADVQRVLSVPSGGVVAMIATGKLRGRLIAGEPMVDGASLDAYTARRVLFAEPKPPTYEKYRDGYRLVIEK
jgi:hypothetical protein